MGWTGYPELNNITAKEFWKHHYLPRVPDWYGENTAEVVAENSYGKEFYAAIRNKKEGYVFPLIALIESGHDGIFIKEMTGDVGPCYYHASEKVLNAVTAKDCLDWVKACREKKAARRNLFGNVTAGTRIKLKMPQVYKGVTWDTMQLINKKKNLFRIEGLDGVFHVPWWKRAEFNVV